jgi:DNA polymerase-3 subunit epsilon/ATP-dependent DNA helicase DinG
VIPPAAPGSQPIPDTLWVSLDLETTGLSVDTDEIIEVGAVKYQGDRKIEAFSQLVNPKRPLTQFIQALTGITDAELSAAPPFSEVAPKIMAFVGNAPVIGHNIPFDLGFLQKKGVRFASPAYDTWDLASAFLPRLGGYTLTGIARHFGITNEHAHRAVHDAETTMGVFLRMVQLLRGLPPDLQSEISRIADRSDWALRLLFWDVFGPGYRAAYASEPGLEGLVVGDVKARLAVEERAPSPKSGAAFDPVEVAGLLAGDGPLARTIAKYEARPQQVAMAQAVGKALAENGQLIVEAGTGTGKSIAYLLPSAVFSLRTGQPVVVSTNTINLQEQLLFKDIPGTLEALTVAGEPNVESFRVALLKGRSNYICMRRWAALKQSQNLSAVEARILVKILIWLQETADGDKGEINLTPPEQPVWHRLSAESFDGGTGPCPFVKKGLCFYDTARRRAEQANLIVVNHALLALDAVHEGLLPHSTRLIIDEAHNLEEVVTDQWGLEIDEGTIADLIEEIIGSTAPQRDKGPGILAPVLTLTRTLLGASEKGKELKLLTEEIQTDALQCQGKVTGLFRLVSAFSLHQAEKSTYDAAVRLTKAARGRPEWTKIEVAWEDVNILLEKIMKGLERLDAMAGRLAADELQNRDEFRLDLVTAVNGLRQVKESLASAVVQPRESHVYWVLVSSRDGNVAIHSAPLHVGAELNERLFDDKESLILTSATLSVGGKMAYVKSRLGLEDADELALGSPFDYPKLALAYTPDDVPEPSQPGYQASLEKVIAEIARAAKGRTMVLFTSWAPLRAARSRLPAALNADGITVIAQGADGSPRQLIEQFKTTPKCLLLATGSFWEGVDIAGEALSVLVIARLPFNVPTDPVFAARSEQFEDAFSQYAIPQAVLRFKQGFGRLIRRKTDRGVLVVLDKRILNARYGAAFFGSIPPCTRKSGPSANLPSEIVNWLAKR